MSGPLTTAPANEEVALAAAYPREPGWQGPGSRTTSYEVLMPSVYAPEPLSDSTRYR
ncbi:hypothetical protein Pa4123_56990 [Phytohabitans aurantiacus]|uniref:Uncharacterized protein n=1 Tax=Phytohabitans aurantiacus TaxID=3016789 RepID=A0ABQ5R2H8_9ACTN|nr:hypothetical protein Pa4123_56990 [Phytohabitans aurantiacus]